MMSRNKDNQVELGTTPCTYRVRFRIGGKSAILCGVPDWREICDSVWGSGLEGNLRFCVGFRIGGKSAILCGVPDWREISDSFHKTVLVHVICPDISSIKRTLFQNEYDVYCFY